MGRMRLWRAAARLAAAFATAAAAALAVLPLATCSNPVDLVDAVTVEVMKGNDRYLEVISISPQSNMTMVNPGDPIVLQFDRRLDAESVTSLNVVFAPPASWNSTFDVATNTLTIQPTSLEGGVSYSISILPGLRGLDGSTLLAEYSWSFTTDNKPTGSMQINGNAAYAISSTVTLNVSANSKASKMRFSEDRSDIEGDLLPWVDTAAAPTFSLSAVDGSKTVYIQFASSDISQVTSIFSDDIVLDTVDPIISSFTIAGNASYSTTQSVSLSASASDATSGLAVMRFLNSGSSWSSWEPWNSTRASWLLTSGDGSKTVYMQVQDKAGRISSNASDGLIFDGTPPAVTSFLVNAGAAYSASTSVTLSAAATDATSGISQVRYGNYGLPWSAWESYGTSRAWSMAAGDGSKVVYYQVRDNAGNVSERTDSIILDTVAPTVSLTIGSGNPASTNTASNTLYITASDATSGLNQAHYGNYGQAYSAWEAYATTKSWSLEDKAGVRRVYVQVTDNAGNISGQIYDEITLNARLVITYSQLFLSSDGDADTLITLNGEIYYRFYVDGVLKLNRAESSYLSLADPVSITTSLPVSAYTIYEDPTSGSFSMTGTVYDDDSPLADDYGTMAAITYSAPFASVPSASRAISGDVAGAIYYSIAFQNP